MEIIEITTMKNKDEILCEVSGRLNTSLADETNITAKEAREAMEIYLQQALASFISSNKPIIKSVCEHTVYDLIYKREHYAKCKCGKEWNYL